MPTKVINTIKQYFGLNDVLKKFTDLLTNSLQESVPPQIGTTCDPIIHVIFTTGPAGGVKVSTTVSAHVQDTQHLTSAARSVPICDKPYGELSEQPSTQAELQPQSSGSQLSGGTKSPQSPCRGQLRTAGAAKMHAGVQVHTLTYRTGCKALTQALVVLIFSAQQTREPVSQALEIKRSKLKMQTQGQQQKKKDDTHR